MCTISLAGILSQNTDFTSAGASFYDSINQAFAKSEKIVVDMQNVTSIPSIFLNVSIGKIIEEFGSARLKRDMTFSRISKAQALRLQEYMKKFQD